GVLTRLTIEIGRVNQARSVQHTSFLPGADDENYRLRGRDQCMQTC
ncbi:MAG: hypothetical protein JWR46_2052, partial [Mycobacterium sp.]|nr:hypothetical protein [Mycobacterium sp.]